MSDLVRASPGVVGRGAGEVAGVVVWAERPLLEMSSRLSNRLAEAWAPGLVCFMVLV